MELPSFWTSLVPKKNMCFFSFIDVFVLSIACICVFIDLLVYVFSLFIHFWYIFLIYSIHFFILLFTDHLLFIYLQYLLYVSSIHSSRYFGLSFVLFLGFSIGLSIYLLGIDFLMYLLVHLFDVGVLPTKFFLQTPPDFTDRIFRWSFHLLIFLFITLTLYYFSLYSWFFWYIFLMYSIHFCTFLIFHLFIMLLHFRIIFLSCQCLQNPWMLLSERQVQHAAKHKKSIEKNKENDEKWIENDERWTIPWFKKIRKTSDKKTWK